MKTVAAVPTPPPTIVSLPDPVTTPYTVSWPPRNTVLVPLLRPITLAPPPAATVLLPCVAKIVSLPAPVRMLNPSVGAPLVSKRLLPSPSTIVPLPPRCARVMLLPLPIICWNSEPEPTTVVGPAALIAAATCAGPSTVLFAVISTYVGTPVVFGWPD